MKIENYFFKCVKISSSAVKRVLNKFNNKNGNKRKCIEQHS